MGKRVGLQPATQPASQQPPAWIFLRDLSKRGSSRIAKAATEYPSYAVAGSGDCETNFVISMSHPDLADTNPLLIADDNPVRLRDPNGDLPLLA